jgi:hypothetical protein
MPRPLKKLASLGTIRRTKPSPPASHAQAPPARRRVATAGVAAMVGGGFVVEPVITQRKETHGRAPSWARASAFAES